MDEATGVIVANHGFQAFWTPYDPIDSDGGSIDPLGFLRAYLALADRLLPGLTTVTNVPRYASMLCAAIVAAEVDEPCSEPIVPAKVRERRLARVKSYERAWALAWGLAARDDERMGTDGLRGIRYVNRRIDALGTATAVKTNSYALLANQVRYGGVGMYAALLDKWHCTSMRHLASKELGRALAAAFPSPDGLRVTDEGAALPLDALREWGRQAHGGTISAKERRPLIEAAKGGEEADEDDRVRWTMFQLLRVVGSDDREARILSAIRRRLESGKLRAGEEEPREQIRAVLRIVEPFEQLFQAVTFFFDALRIEAEALGAVRPREFATAGAPRAAAAAASRASALLRKTVGEPDVAEPRAATEVRAVLRESGLLALATDIEQFAPADVGERLLARHRAVQAGKFDGGVPKGAWVVPANGDSVRLASQRFQVDRRARKKRWQDMPRHAYRTNAAFAFLRAGGLLS